MYIIWTVIVELLAGIALLYVGTLLFLHPVCLL